MKLSALLLLLWSVPSFAQETNVPLSTPTVKPEFVRGIHLTSWFTGSKKGRAYFEPLFEKTELNTAVIDVKEINGDVYVPGVDWSAEVAEAIKETGLDPTVRAIPDLENYLRHLREKGVFTIARLVVFQDQTLPKLIPDWAVNSSSVSAMALEKGFAPNVWVDFYGNAWVDPYNPKVHEYNIRIAERAADLGFQGVQFDYIRFPADGHTRFCVYPSTSARSADPGALAAFLEKASKRLRPKGVEVSIDVFGLAGSYDNDLGIGQKLDRLLTHIDAVSPMMYPSHYAPGEFGIDEPNDQPYDVIARSVRDTLRVLNGSGVELRPFFQDFSIRGKMKYDANMVRKQIQAAEDLGVMSWLLWNAKCRYTEDALRPPAPSDPSVVD